MRISDWSSDVCSSDLLQDGHPERGLALAKQGSHPLADKIVAWLNLGRRDAQADFAALSAFLDANPDWPGLYGLYRNAERQLPQDLSSAEVLSWFGDRLPITGAGALRHVAALWDSGQQARARAAARQYWVAMHFTTDAEAAFHSRLKTLLREEACEARPHRLPWDHRSAGARPHPPRRPSVSVAPRCAE